MRRAWRLAAVLLAAVAAGCAAPPEPVVVRSPSGPTAREVFTVRAWELAGREPSFEERRLWEEQLDLRVGQYLRDHPELEQSPRYADFRMLRQVTLGSRREEVRVLLEAPRERTRDPERLAALAAPHWEAIRGRATEAWVYPAGWVLFFDDAALVDILRRSGPPRP
jgi:hypothetical protein